MVAAAAMSLSSVFVVGCSLQLRAFSPARPQATRVRRLALAAGVALSPSLTQPATGPPVAGHPAHQEQP